MKDSAGTIGKYIGEAKQSQLIQQLKKIPEYYKEFSDTATITNGKDIRLLNFNSATFYEQKGRENNSGIIFFPHRTRNFGVKDNTTKLT